MTMENYRYIMDIIGTAVDGVGVFIVVGGALVATARLALHRTQSTGNYYSLYRQDVGRAILLGLEFLIAGDIIRTVVVAPTLQNVLVLGVIVLIRTFLSLSRHFNWKSKENCPGAATRRAPTRIIEVAQGGKQICPLNYLVRQQDSPEMAARPSLITNGISASAATLSSHHQPSSQVAAKPIIKTI